MRKTLSTIAAAVLVAPAFSQTCLGGPDAFEPNDSCAAAAAVPGNVASGLTVETTNIDFFEITVPDGQEALVTATHVIADGDIDLYLWDPAVLCGTETIDPGTGMPVGEGLLNGSLAQGWTFNEPETMTYPNNSGAAQTLVVEVRLWSGDTSGSACNDYELDYAFSPIGTCQPDSFEPSDGCTAAPTLPNGLHPGLSVTDVNRDYYAINLAPGEEVTASVLFSQAIGDLDVHLWDTAVACDSLVEGEFAASAIQLSISLTDNEFISWINTTGATQNLVMEVGIFSGNAAICVPYDIDILQQSSPCSSPDAFEDNEDCPGAAPISDGSFPGLNVSVLDRDFYSMTVPDGATLTVDCLFQQADGDIDIYLWDPLLACDTFVAGSGSQGNALVASFTETDDENIVYTNTTGAPLDVVLEIDTFNPGPLVTCAAYELVITGLAGGQPPLGLPFCNANPNTTGLPGLISATGSSVVADNDVTLRVAQIPPGQFGIFVVAAAAGANTPVNSGVLCLSGPIGRYDQGSFIWQADAIGEASRAIDIQMIPTPTAFVGTSPGDTWYFQAWHRDLPSGNSNFTTGVEVTFN